MRSERKCNCCIEVEDSIVVMVCGEIEFDRLNGALNTALDMKAKKV